MKDKYVFTYRRVSGFSQTQRVADPDEVESKKTSKKNNYKDLKPWKAMTR